MGNTPTQLLKSDSEIMQSSAMTSHKYQECLTASLQLRLVIVATSSSPSFIPHAIPVLF
jgi:hypothetical protein